MLVAEWRLAGTVTVGDFQSSDMELPSTALMLSVEGLALLTRPFARLKHNGPVRDPFIPTRYLLSRQPSSPEQGKGFRRDTPPHCLFRSEWFHGLVQVGLTVIRPSLSFRSSPWLIDRTIA